MVINNNKTMKKLKTIALLALLSASSAFAQNSNGVRDAINALQGTSKNMSHEEAITILTSYATNDTNAVAMNALGNVYASGIGTDMDMNKAVHWYEMAAANGMLIAYHNLGMIFKNATNGVEQDFTKACSYFSKGAAEGSPVCNYNYGFMLYKGLGCSQDYGKAVECFKKAAANKHAASLYMLGLCYRNGYGVDADNGVAKDYLVQSANLGHNDAIDELLRPEPENIGLTGDDIINDSLPQAMPQVEAGFLSVDMLTGVYDGILVTYDWSGQYILGEQPIKISMNSTEKEVTGKIHLNGQKVDFIAEIDNEGKLIFKNSEVLLDERYTGGDSGVKYNLQSAVLEKWNNRICGRLYLYSTLLNEPERPMYIEIMAGAADTATENSGNNVYISPNPFVHDFTAHFELDEDVPSVEVRIFNNDGTLAERQSFGALQKGDNQLNITPQVRQGSYILNIQTEKKTLRTIIRKNR